MARIRVENVTKRFGDITAVNNLSLEVADGEFFTLLGPPGAGKTTTLRLIVGLETPDSGRVYLDDQDVTDVYPGKRDIAMIFQNLALYPDKTAFENMAYPLRERRMSSAEIKAKVQEVAKVLRIDHRLQQKPGQLSGGERQRVAIGRAIVRRPRAYLMDEPLSALDALLRLEMRVELKRLQRDLGQTLVYVTHDQVEAMSMSDRVAVLRSGVIQQIDTPERVYNFPANRFVATVIGSPPMNFIPCRLDRDTLVHPAFRLRLCQLMESINGDQVAIGIRPEHVQMELAPGSAGAIPATIFATEPLGAEVVVDLHIGDLLLKAIVPSPFEGALNQQAYVHLNSQAASLLDTRTDQFIVHGTAEAPLWQDHT